MASQCCFVVSVLLCLLALAASQEVKSPEGACLLPKQSGPCKAFFKKYYYDQAEARCRSFVYGGCNGNDNQFDSWELCREACEGKPSDESICQKSNCPKCTVCRARRAPCPVNATESCEPFYCRPLGYWDATKGRKN